MALLVVPAVRLPSANGVPKSGARPKSYPRTAAFAPAQACGHHSSVGGAPSRSSAQTHPCWCIPNNYVNRAQRGDAD